MSCCSKKLGVAWAASLAAAGAVGMLIAGGATAQPEGEMPAEMAEWMAAGQPNDHHKALEPLVGSFRAEMWFDMPGQPRQETTGESHNQWLFDGRYLGTHFTADFMGMPFEGHGVMGYDNLEKHYFSGWIDNMSTGLFVEHGQMSGDGKTITLKGSLTGPDGQKQSMKHVYTIYSNDKHKMEFFEAPAGQDLVKTGEIVYTRM